MALCVHHVVRVVLGPCAGQAFWHNTFHFVVLLFPAVVFELYINNFVGSMA